MDSERPMPLVPPKLETEGAISAIWLKSAVVEIESWMNDREMMDWGCVVLSDAVTGAISFGLVAVTMIVEPSAILSSSAAGASAAYTDVALAMKAAPIISRASVVRISPPLDSERWSAASRGR